MSAEGARRSGLGAVVVTYFSEDVIGECLESLPAGLRVVVVDNASRDGTANAVRRTRPDADLVVRSYNAGFAASVNLGLTRLGPVDFALLLNPDARLAPGALDALAAFLESRPRAAIVSAAVVDPAGAPEPVSGGREPTLLSGAVHYLGLGTLAPRLSLYSGAPRAGAERRDWVAGTCALVRSAAVDAVGALDESYFLYCEDIDWCRRMRAAGWEVWVTAGARSVHHRSSSVDAAGSWIDVYRTGSLDRYFARHHTRAALWGFRVTRGAGLAGRSAVLASTGLVTGRPELRARGRQRWRDAKHAVRPPRI